MTDAAPGNRTMLIVPVLLLNLVGAALIYLASARQRLLRRPLAPLAGILASASIIAGLASWIVEAGCGAGIMASLTSWMLMWVALPYACWWRHGNEARQGRRG
jgi:hypothetical protein